MKSIILFFLLCFSQAFGQQRISKQIDYHNELIVVEFDNIDELKIEQAENTVLTVEMVGQQDKLSALDVRQSSGLILITAEEYIDQSANPIDKFCKIQPLYNVYTLKIPQGAAVEVYYSEGNFSAAQFSGNMKVTLARGNINLTEVAGNFEFELFAGNVNASLKNTAFDIDTSLGKFSTDLAEERYTEKPHHFNGVYGNPNNFLKVHSVRANIELKAAKNQ